MESKRIKSVEDEVEESFSLLSTLCSLLPRRAL